MLLSQFLESSKKVGKFNMQFEWSPWLCVIAQHDFYYSVNYVRTL